MDFQTDYKSYLKDSDYAGQKDQSATQSADSPSSETVQQPTQFEQDYQQLQGSLPQNKPGAFDAITQSANVKTQIANQLAQQKQESADQLQMENEMKNSIEAYRSQNTEATPEQIAGAVTTAPAQTTGETQRGILSGGGTVTQQFGNRNPIEKYSKGINYGTDIAVPIGTKVALPPGQWKVVEAFNKATASGANNTQGGINNGYGNSILVQNPQTGEKLRFSHLSNVGVQPGQTINGGLVVGKTGATGNVTGAHLDLEYYNNQGKLANVLTSPYARYLVGK